MKKLLSIFIILLFSATFCSAQQLSFFSETMSTGGKAWLSISNKKAYTEKDAAAVKSSVDFTIVFTRDEFSPKLEWYNLSGKDSKIPEQMIGTNSKINAISFDREQFDKCKTVGDFQRMTTHITSSSLSHFAVISYSNAINQHCFIVELENRKRGLIWVSTQNNNEYKIELKMQP